MINDAKFLKELTAAGLAAVPFSYSEDGLVFADAVSPVTRAQVQAVFDAHDGDAPDAADIAARRYKAEVAGCPFTLASGETVTVRTDRESRAILHQELDAIAHGWRVSGSPWKFAEGFRLVSNAEFPALVLAVRTYVLACFSEEAAKLAALSGNEPVDLEEGWP